MRQGTYSDGSPSREMQEDWEVSGQQEFNRLHEMVNKQKSAVNAIKDRLRRINSLVKICSQALLCGDDFLDTPSYTPYNVADVLSDYVCEDLEKTQQELRYI